MGFWDNAADINKDVLGLTMILSGLFICFFGAKFFKHIIFFVGFILGGMGAYFLIPDFIGIFGFTISDEMLLYVSLAIGAAVGILFVVIYKVAVFCCGGVCGILVAQAIWQSIILPLGLDEDMPYPDVIQVVAWVLFFILGGWLAFKLAEFLLKGITAFLGAFLFASSVAYFIQRLDGSNDADDVISWIQFFTTSTNYRAVGATCNAYCYICLSLWIILFLCGCYIQYKFHKRHKREHYDDDIEESYEEELEGTKELNNRKAKREAAKRRSQQGGIVQPVRDSSADMGRNGWGSGNSAGASPQGYTSGRASYYTQNQGYNGYSPNYVAPQQNTGGYYTNNV